MPTSVTLAAELAKHDPNKTLRKGRFVASHKHEKQLPNAKSVT